MITTPWKERTWKDYLTEAHSIFNSKGSNRIAPLVGKLENIWEESEELQELYNEAASVIVEPNVWVETHNEEDYEKSDKIMQPYYNMGENNNTPVNEILEITNQDGQDWKFIVDYIIENGY